MRMAAQGCHHAKNALGAFYRRIQARCGGAKAVVIDGYTQPGATPNTSANADDAFLKIVLDGSLLPHTGAG